MHGTAGLGHLLAHAKTKELQRRMIALMGPTSSEPVHLLGVRENAFVPFLEVMQYSTPPMHCTGNEAIVWLRLTMGYLQNRGKGRNGSAAHSAALHAFRSRVEGESRILSKDQGRLNIKMKRLTIAKEAHYWDVVKDVDGGDRRVTIYYGIKTLFVKQPW